MNDLKIAIPDEHFESVLICAVRYCIGRRTYMPELVTHWIMGHCKGQLSRKTLGVMQRDIETAYSLGDTCDVQTWNAFQVWLNKEVSGDV